MRFKDEAKVHVKGGDGGSGSVHWRAEKYIPKGGPDGGNGGNGGAVIFLASSELNTLVDFSFTPILEAEDGQAGAGARCDGKNGEDRLVRVPVGTQVFYDEQLVADLSQEGAHWIAARGGRGGKGNAHFKSSTNRAPQRAQPGRKGEGYELKLVLKSVADVGLVGLPNVGKSTLISAISNARPLVADYPFTTLTPHLGVVMLGEGRRFVIADIPGLIPEAHTGKGLGLTFLKHIERTTVLAQLIDLSVDISGNKQSHLFAETDNKDRIADLAEQQLRVIEEELGSFSPELLKLPRLIVFSKCELGLAALAYEALKPQLKARGLEGMLISSHTGEGLEALKQRLGELVESSKKAAEQA